MGIHIERKIASLVVGGGSGIAARAIGILHANTTSVGNVGAGEDTLMTYDLAANTMLVVGQTLRILQAGRGSGTVNARTLKLYFGTAELTQGGFALVTGVGTHWRAETFIVRTSANAQRTTVRLVVSNNDSTGTIQSDKVWHATTTQTETAATTIKATATSVADNDLIQDLALIELLT